MTERSGMAFGRMSLSLRMVAVLSMACCGGKLEGSGVGDRAWWSPHAWTSQGTPVGLDESRASCRNPQALLIDAIAIGGMHICVRTIGGGVRCRGNNDYGQLGYPPIGSTARSAEGDVVSGVTAIAAGHVHTCALMNDSSVRCWGGNGSGQLGRGDAGVSGQSVSGNYSLENYIYPWSEAANVVGPNDNNEPLRDVVSIAAGYEHTCALKASGTVYCWGGNGSSQLGDINAPSSGTSSPAAPVGVSNAFAIAVGYEHSCAATWDDGQIWCWGRDPLGASTLNANPTPKEVEGLHHVSKLVAGEKRTCALMPSSVQCSGQPALAVSELSELTDIAAGSNHTCAVVAGSVDCWGSNDSGQLGVGGVSATSAVGVLSGVHAVFAGGAVTCALKRNFGVSCWGDNSHCQILSSGEDEEECKDGNANRNWTTPTVPDGLCQED